MDTAIIKGFDSYKVLQFYHTSTRNIGLYTSLSFASLAYSRAHRGKNNILNISLIVISIVFTSIALIIIKYLLDDLKRIHDTDPVTFQIVQKWTIIPNIMRFVNYFLLVASSMTLFTEVTSMELTGGSTMTDPLRNFKLEFCAPAVLFLVAALAMTFTLKLTPASAYSRVMNIFVILVYSMLLIYVCSTKKYTLSWTLSLFPLVMVGVLYFIVKGGSKSEIEKKKRQLDEEKQNQPQAVSDAGTGPGDLQKKVQAEATELD